MLRPACYVVVGISCFLLTVSASPVLFEFNDSSTLVDGLTTFAFTEETTEHDSHDAGGHSSLALASWNYEYVAIPLDISLFILFAGLVKITFHHVPYLSSYIPESCILIAIGTIMGAILYFAAGVPDSFKLESSTFMLYLLPPIVLEAAYSLNDRTFSDNIGTILLYAVVGTVINFVIIGFSMYGLDMVGAMGLPDSLPVTMLEFLLFASLIVAVDPVAVLVIFQDVGVHKTLYFLVFGESLLNGLGLALSEYRQWWSFLILVIRAALSTVLRGCLLSNYPLFVAVYLYAVTIVLNNMMRAFNDAPEIDANATLPSALSAGANSLSFIITLQGLPAIMIGIGSFFTISLGALAIGILFGIASSLLTRITGHVRVVEPLAILIMAYLSYLCAELFHWSGIISMIGCGLVQAQYALFNISRKSNITVHYFIKMLSSTCESVIFMFLGLELVRTNHVWNTGFVLWTLFFCLVGRVISVFGLTFFVNLQSKTRKIKLEEQFIMWYGGLRGAIAFALCSTVEVSEDIKNMFLTTTFFIIIFTVVFQGVTIKPLVKYCKIMMQGEESKELFAELQILMNGSLISGLEIIAGQQGTTGFHAWVYKMNDKYLKRWFQKNPMSEKEQFLDLYRQVSLQYYEAMMNNVVIPVPDILKLGEYSDLESDLNKEEEFASAIKYELQAGKEATSKLHLSRGDMRRILSQATLAKTGWVRDRDLVYNDYDEMPQMPLITLNDDYLRPAFEGNPSGLISLNGSMQQLSVGDHTPLGSTGMLRGSQFLLTPTNSGMRVRRTSLTTGYPRVDESGFQLKKATSVMTLSEAQDRMIVPTLAVTNSSVQRQLKKRKPNERSSSVVDPPRPYFAPARSRKNSTSYDQSKRLTTLGEEYNEDVTTPDDPKFLADQSEANKHGAYINQMMYSTMEEESGREAVTESRDHEESGNTNDYEDSDDNTSL